MMFLPMFGVLPDWVTDALAFITQLWTVVTEAFTNLEAAIAASFLLQILVGITLLFLSFKVVNKIVGIIKRIGA